MALHHDTAISITSLHRVIQDPGLSLKMLHKAASERDEVAQEEFRTYVWEHLVAEQVVTADDIVAAISVEGYVGTQVVLGSVDGDDFFEFIVEDVLPQMNPFPQDRSVLILDNCAIHKSAALCEVIEAKGCILLFLP
ncbi:hypothetical protein PILCRDRAFT_795832, partial [Piloderma croceum F 1598]